MIKDSLIYNGKVVHRRFKPKEHYFKYNVFSLLINLDELTTIQNKIRIFSYNKFNILSFFDKDHGPRDGSSIKEWHDVCNKNNYKRNRKKLFISIKR